MGAERADEPWVETDGREKNSLYARLISGTQCFGDRTMRIKRQLL